MTEEDKTRHVQRRDNYSCRICGKPCNGKWQSKAHLLGQGKLQRKLHGSQIIDSVDCVVLTCSLECNKKADLSRNTEAVASLKQIFKLEDEQEKKELINAVLVKYDRRQII